MNDDFPPCKHSTSFSGLPATKTASVIPRLFVSCSKVTATATVLNRFVYWTDHETRTVVLQKPEEWTAGLSKYQVPRLQWRQRNKHAKGHSPTIGVRARVRKTQRRTDVHYPINREVFISARWSPS